MFMTRQEMAAIITARLTEEAERMRTEFHLPDRIRSTMIDDLLPEDLVRSIYEAYPPPEKLIATNSVREHKYVTAQMDSHDPVLEEILFSFQEPQVVEVIKGITGMPSLEPDGSLFAAGISLMNKGCYLTPHLDTSHDLPRERYRVLNLLFYVTPDWKLENGGNLQLWDKGLKGGPPREVLSRFNRLVLMATNRKSIHSVNHVKVDAERCCVSNYYFSRTPISPEGKPVDQDYFHVTEYKGFPDDKLAQVVLKGDTLLKTAYRKVRPKGRPNQHVYQQTDS